MAGSTDLATSPSRQKAKERWLAKLASGELDATPANKKTDPDDLPRWVKAALIRKMVDGMSYKDAAAEVGKKGSSLANYAKSPAAKAWLAPLMEFVDDPVAMAKAYLAGNAMGVTLDRMMFLEMAKANGDYTTGDKIAKDLQEKLGIVAKKEDSGAIKVEVRLGATSLEVPMIEAEYELVEENDED